MGTVHVGWTLWAVASAQARQETAGGPSGVSGRPSYSDASDDVLMAWSAAGDRRAFDGIVVRHGPQALRVARRLVGDPVTAEDIVQEAMVRIWQRAAAFDAARGPFAAWLYRVIANLVVDQQRRRPVVTLPNDYDAPDPSPGADDALVTTEDVASLRRAMGGLRPQHRLAVALVYGEGLSTADTARQLGLSPKAVERLLARARTALRAELSRPARNQ